MIRRTAVAAAVLALVGAAAAPALASTRGAHAVPKHLGPAVIAWYDEARPTASTPAAPMPGVGPKDLLVQGITIDFSQLPVALPPLPPLKQVTAFAALSFRIPTGASPGSLTLDLTGLTTAKLDAKLPSGAAPIACAATGHFKSGAEQPFAAAPTYDCKKRFAIGQLSTDGKAIVFPGIGRLLTGRKLSVVILPGSLGLERLVFTAPTKKSLSLLNFAGPPAPVESLPPLPTIAPTTPAQPSGSVPSVPVPAVANASVPPATAPTPKVAAPATTAVPQAPSATVKPVDDNRARTAAIGGLVALIVITAWLSSTERLSSKKRQGTPAVAGVGKFRAPRTGPPPAI